MAYYRLYFLDGAQRIEHFREFELADDALATRQAAEWRCTMAMELWCGPRMVRRWDRPPSSQAARCVREDKDLTAHRRERQRAGR
jgi:hypothetical protein